MKNLFALLVAINEYQDAPLHGCVHDAQQFHEFLAAHCERVGLQLHARTLINEEATRNNIIAAFDHFNDAADTDQRLFFYAGHGSRCLAPAEFHHLEPDGMMESIVCFDSRSGDRDLLDKELSYLIWKATPEAGPPFITIMDSCHSGSFRSSTEDDQVALRQMSDSDEGPKAADLLGVDEYQQDSLGRMSPPRARRVHLAAARDTEYAREIKIGPVRCGVFTFSLLENLRQATGHIAYDELSARINRRIQQAVRHQSSHIEATQAEDKRLLFLSNDRNTGVPPYLVSHTRQLGWHINAGALHGLRKGSADNRLTLELLEDQHPITIQEVQPTYSTVGPMEGYETTRSYQARITRWPQPGLKVAFSENSDPEGMARFRSIMDLQAPGFTIQDEPADADLILQANEQGFSVRRTHDATAIFRPTPGLDENAAESFFHEVQQIARWYEVLHLQHPQSTIREDEIEVELFRLSEPGSYENDAPMEAVDWRSSPRFDYLPDGPNWAEPAFQLKIRNAGLRPLWVSILYLSDNFGITNQLLPVQQLEPDAEIWATDVHNGFAYLTIPLKIDDLYLEHGIDTLQEHIKIMISSAELDTDRLNQPGLELSRPGETGPPRGFGRMQRDRPDWAVKDIPLTIHRSMVVT